MPPRLIAYNTAMDTLWSECIYTEARLQKDPLAAAHAPAFDALAQRAVDTKRAQQGCWREEIIAQAGVDAADDRLDDRTEGLSEELLRAVKGDRKAARYTRYFKQGPPSSVVKLGVESQVAVVNDWPASLKTEAEPAVQAHGTGLETDVAVAKAELAARSKAFAATADHRAREIVKLVDDVNAARLSVYGLLVGLVEPNKLPRAWPDRFFRKESREKKAAGVG
ncbi:MAG: hypothetical protein HY904_19095 [Deltaproteobacteria bacterium]|nr:hypothetical protein [Deltaproteobacteria bacterium]